MSDSKVCKVIIFGEEYALTTSETELHLLQAATTVDSLMRSLADRTKVRDAKRIAVLAALRLASGALIVEEKLKKIEALEQDILTRIDREMLYSE